MGRWQLVRFFSFGGFQIAFVIFLATSGYKLDQREAVHTIVKMAAFGLRPRHLFKSHVACPVTLTFASQGLSVSICKMELIAPAL